MINQSSIIFIRHYIFFSALSQFNNNIVILSAPEYRPFPLNLWKEKKKLYMYRQHLQLIVSKRSIIHRICCHWICEWKNILSGVVALELLMSNSFKVLRCACWIVETEQQKKTRIMESAITHSTAPGPELKDTNTLVSHDVTFSVLSDLASVCMSIL